jgi:hypothetical protein
MTSYSTKEQRPWKPFYVVRYSCDVTDAILIPLLYDEFRHIEIAFMRQADTTFPKRYCAMPTLNIKLSLIGCFKSA